MILRPCSPFGYRLRHTPEKAPTLWLGAFFRLMAYSVK